MSRVTRATCNPIFLRGYMLLMSGFLLLNPKPTTPQNLTEAGVAGKGPATEGPIDSLPKVWGLGFRVQELGFRI